MESQSSRDQLGVLQLQLSADGRVAQQNFCFLPRLILDIVDWVRRHDRAPWGTRLLYRQFLNERQRQRQGLSTEYHLDIGKGILSTGTE